jgi:hypothetical protein
MRLSRVAATAVLSAVFSTGGALADGSATTTLPPWVTPLVGQKLIAIDGSSLLLASQEGGMSLTRTAPNGASQATNFEFLSERLGTISEGGDGSAIIGFFRLANSSIEVQYADGSTESVFVNSGHGLSLAAHGSGGGRCLSWYPSDHVFGVAERRAAVAAFAASLGLNETPKTKAKAAVEPPSCAIAPPVQPVAPQMAAKSHYTITQNAPAGPLAQLVPVSVRTSEIHAVPDQSIAKASEAPAAKPPAAIAAAQQAAPANAPVLASAVASALPSAAVQQLGRGASDCLHVENDGANLGFRNHCSFSVQFVYCLQGKNDPRAVCNLETRTGSVAASGFTPLLTDTNIRSADAEHDFRWVACSGAANDVTAYLDRSEPPSGRCVRSNAS